MGITLKDIAEKAGVTKMTVSYALRNHPRISQKTRDRVQKIAQELGYQSNPMLASLSKLKRNPSHTHHGNLACIVGHTDANPMSRNRSYVLTYKGLKERAKELNFAIDLFWAYDPALKGKLLEDMLRSRSICGIALLAVNETELALDWKQYAVAYATSMHRQNNRSFSHTQNNLAGILQLALKKVLELGYRRIGLCVGGLNLTNSQGLFHGCLAYTRHTLNTPYPPDIPVFSHLYSPTDRKHKGAQKDFKKWYHRYKPEIIISQNYNSSMEDLGRLFSPELDPREKIVTLDLRSDKNSGFAGIQIDHVANGHTVMDLITEQVFSNHFGPPEKPKTVTTNNFSWVPGKLKPPTGKKPGSS